MTNQISVTSLEKGFKKSERKIKSEAAKILEILKQKKVSAAVFLANNSQMKLLNKKFRGKNKIADVLSFEEPFKFVNPDLKFKKIGEVYLNMEQPEKEFSKKFLLAHGLLHLLGYDHIKKSDAVKMEKMEKYIVSKF